MVQEVFADNRGAAAVKVHRGNVGGVVGDEEVAVDAGENAQQDGTGDAQFIGQRQHGHHHGALGVDKDAHQEEHQGDAPGIGRYQVREHQFHLVHVVAEVGVGQPGDAVDGHHGHHAALPYGAGHGRLGRGLAEHDVGCGGRQHDNLDADVHLGQVDGLGNGAAIGHMEHLAEGEAHNDQKGAQEDVHRGLGLPRDNLVQRSGGVAVHVFVHLRIGLSFEEVRILVQVFAALVGGGGGAHEANYAGRDGDHEHLGNAYHVAVGVGNGDEGHHGRGDGRAGDAHLRGHGGNAAGTLRADVLLEGDVADDGHDGVHHMARPHQYREEEGYQRAQEGDVVRMFAEHLLRNLDHPVHTARCLQRTCAGYGRNDDIDDVCGGRSRFEAEAEHQDGQADSADGSQGQRPVTGTHIQCCQNDEQLHNHDKSHSAINYCL